MEDPEVPLEKVQEHIEHHAHEAEHEGAKSKWISLVALVTSVLATFAAIASLMAGDNANEAMIKQIKSSDTWNYYQAKSIKSAIEQSRLDLLEADKKKAPPEAYAKLESYIKERDEIRKKAEDLGIESDEHLHRHVIFAHSTTMFQVGIAVAAISILTKRRRFFIASSALGIFGILFLVQGCYPPWDTMMTNAMERIGSFLELLGWTKSSLE